MVGGRFEAGMVVYGVPVGTDNYVKHMLMQKLDELTERAEMSCSVLGEEKLLIWKTLALLSLSCTSTSSSPTATILLMSSGKGCHQKLR